MGEQKNQGRKKNVSWLRFLEKNQRTIVVVLGGIVLVCIGVVIGLLAGGGIKPASSRAPEESKSETVMASETGTLQESEGETLQAQPEDVLLEVDAHPEVNTLMAQYYQAVTEGNRERIKELTDLTDNDEEALTYYVKRSIYLEAYQDLKCYTKVGPIDGSYVVYVSYNVKFRELEPLVPGVSPFLVCPRGDGSLYIHEGTVDENVNEYLEEISIQDDVVDLMNEIQVKYNNALADETVNYYLAKMKEEVKVAVGEALAEAKTEQANEEEQQQASNENDSNGFAAGTKVRATAVVNVRKSDSEQADRVGKVQVGDILTLLESRANGWSKIEFNGEEAFVKSEYLAAEATGEGSTGDNAHNGDGATPSSGDAAGNTSVPNSGTIQVASTVNIRKSANESAEKIGVCYQGEKLEILMPQADGWTKVKFEGKTGYVKSDVLKALE